MQKHEYFEELCALSATGQLSDEEYGALVTHLDACVACRESASKFALVLNNLPADDEDGSGELFTDLHLASYRERFLSNAEAAGFRFSGRVRANRSRERQRVRKFFRMRVPLWTPISAAAVLLLVSGFALRQGQRPYPLPVDNMQTSHLPLATPLAPSADTRDANGQMRGSGVVQDMKPKDETRSRLAALDSTLQSYRSENLRLRALLFAEQKESSGTHAKWEEANSQLLKANTELDRLRMEHDSDTAAMVAQQFRLNELTEQLVQEHQAAERERQLSAATGDVRQMMAARSLHIIDVYDVDSKGKARKSFGRIFYTEGKTLLFYAFDLAQKSRSGTTKVSFQAWGQRESGGAEPKNLGIFTLDDHDQQRWVLRIDDPAKFAAIDSVFVTVERHGGADRPMGQKLLYAYIGTPANHP